MLYIEMTTDSSFCQQRFLTQLYNIPPNRITPDNPYASGSFTKHQLDMRRKTEILKYSANKSSTQTNNLTKKEKYALFARGGMLRVGANITNNPINCSLDDTIPTPTSSCNVPGPVTYLTYDSTVPLYNYSGFNARPYSEIAQDYSKPWQFVVLPNILVYDNGTSVIHHLIINNTISKSAYEYTVTVPFGISVAGIVPAYNATTSAFSGTVKVSLIDAILKIYFNKNNLVKNINASNLTNFDVSLNIPANLTSSPKPFSMNQFIGNITFRNVNLYTTPSYVYTFMLNANLTVTPNNTGLFNYIAVIANMSSVVSESNGCTILSTFAAVNTGASITGV